MIDPGEYRALRQELCALLSRRARGVQVAQQDIDAVQGRLKRIEHEIAEIPDPVKREIYRLRCVDGLTVTQIAARWNCSRSTIYNTLRNPP